MKRILQSIPTFICIMTVVCGSLAPSVAQAKLTKRPKELEGVTVQQKLGNFINLNLVFTDHNGKKKALREYFDGTRPVLLTLNYYNCPQLCTFQLNGLVKGLGQLKANTTSDFRIVTISINPKETAKLARLKRKAYLKQLAEVSTKSETPRKWQWDFLVGEERDIKTLAKSLGFGYRYIPKSKEYAHMAVIFFLSAKGKIVQYLQGIQYPARDIRFAVVSASQGKKGSLLERIVMSCFVYDPAIGKYRTFAFGMVRLGGVLTVIFLGLFLGFFWLREQRQLQQVGS